MEDWLPGVFFNEYKLQFDRAGPVNGRLSPDKVRTVLMGTGASMATLADVWELADADKNGELDLEEFCLAMFLSMQAQAGAQLPDRTKPLPRE
mmetsp:Transcript_34786/g.109233  ORF Transcript_34786/g.109233 Transcript_34786/m.109233 type:complete len:93 (-) Transcript_34786:492-770(-)